MSGIAAGIARLFNDRWQMVIIYAGDVCATLQAYKANKKQSKPKHVVVRLLWTYCHVLCTSHKTQYVFLIDLVMPRPSLFAARAHK